MTWELFLWTTPSLDLLEKPQPRHNHRPSQRQLQRSSPLEVPVAARMDTKRAARELGPQLLNPPRPSLGPLRPRPIGDPELHSRTLETLAALGREFKLVPCGCVGSGASRPAVG
jgi:hypothetical protein